MLTSIKRNRGFTLIELMIAVAILAIVMGIAIPSYTQYVINSGRADGKAELFRVAQVLERCYTRYNSYVADECALSDGDTTDSEKGKYQVTIEATAATFTLTAAPQGGQTQDDKCKSFTLTHTGQRGLDGDPEGTVDECW
jgi:type IV pilus assembly protein PilE